MRYSLPPPRTLSFSHTFSLALSAFHPLTDLLARFAECLGGVRFAELSLVVQEDGETAKNGDENV